MAYNQANGYNVSFASSSPVEASVSFSVDAPLFSVGSGPVITPSSAGIGFDVDAPVFSVSGGPIAENPSAGISFEVDVPSFIIRGGPVVAPQSVGAITISFAPSTITITFKEQ